MDLFGSGLMRDITWFMDCIKATGISNDGFIRDTATVMGDFA